MIIVVPLVVLNDAEFEGADDQAGDVVESIEPGFEPWAEPLWEPPSGEVESLLFSVQIGIGAGAMGFILGSLREKSKHANN